MSDLLDAHRLNAQRRVSVFLAVCTYVPSSKLLDGFLLNLESVLRGLQQ